jgi:hypothetical protein
MSIKKVLLLTSVGIVNVFGAAPAGFGYSVTAKGVNTFNEIITPYVFSYLSDLTLPDKQITGGNLTNIHFGLDQPPKPEDIEFILNPSTNGIQFNTSDLTAHVSANFYFQYLFVTVSGTAKIDMTKIVADLGVDFFLQKGANGEKAPGVKSRDVELVINSDNISIDLEGEGVARIADLFKPLIKKFISD